MSRPMSVGSAVRMHACRDIHTIEQPVHVVWVATSMLLGMVDYIIYEYFMYIAMASLLPSIDFHF